MSSAATATHGLARSHLALQQAVHRHRAREVGADHVERVGLVRGEVVRAARRGSGAAARRRPGARCRRAPPRSRRLRSDERDLDAEELVEAQPSLRLLAVLRRLGLVHVAVRPRALGQLLELGAQVRRTSGSARSPAKSSAARDRALDLPRRDVGLPRLRVDRHDHAGLHLPGATEHVDDRVRELALAPEDVELPVERDLGADRELALASTAG